MVKWEQLQRSIQEDLSEADPPARETAASGQTKGDADVMSKMLLVEAKWRDKPVNAVFKKTEKAARLLEREPCVVREGNDKIRTAEIRWDFLMSLLKVLRVD